MNQPVMKLAFDAKRAAQNRTGLGNYSRFVLEGLCSAFPDRAYELYVPSREKARLLGALEEKPCVSLRFPQGGVWRRCPSLWRVFGMSGQIARDVPQVFHGLSNELPVGIERIRGLRTVVTLHDLIFLRYPEFYPAVDRRIYALKFRSACRRADCVVAAYPNREGKASLENAAYEFTDSHWGKMLVLALEWAPRDEVLAWAKQLADGPYKNHKVMLLIHSFLDERTARRTENENYRIQPRNYGQDVWEKLVYPCHNIQLVMCGHTGKPGPFEDSVAFRRDKNAAGKAVNQMMFNVQVLGGGWEGNGGDGWLRILEFMPDGRTIQVRTYSPLFGISPSTKHLAHRTGACDRFDMTWE